MSSSTNPLSLLYETVSSKFLAPVVAQLQVIIPLVQAVISADPTGPLATVLANIDLNGLLKAAVVAQVKA